MQQQLLKSWGLLAPFLAIVLGGLAFLWNPVPVQVLRHAIFDQYQRWQPRDYQPAGVRIIDIDDESLKRLGQWPWPRTRIAELTTRLQAAQPKAIAFDILFAEPDRTSPLAMLALWQAPADILDALQHLPDHDAVFARAIQLGKVVLGVSLERLGSGNGVLKPKAGFVAMGEPAQPFLPGFSSSGGVLERLYQPADGAGAITFVPDTDGVVRRVPLLLRVGNDLQPTLWAEALRVAQGAQNFTTRTAAAKGVGVQEIRIGRMPVTTTPNGEIWVHYTRPAPQRTIAAWQLFTDDAVAGSLHGQIVLVGTSAQGLMDLRFSPLGVAIPGIEIHAQVIEQVLTGTGLERPSWALSIEALAIVLGALAVGLTALASGALWSSGVFALLLAATCGGAWWAFSSQRLLLDPGLVSLTLALSFLLSSGVHHLATERRQAWVRLAFSRYVSPNLVAHLIAHPHAMALGGKRQQCSFVFTDLAGFTRLMETIDPAESVALLNAYLDRMIAIAFAHEGTLDRIVGDAVAIMFSAPLAQADHQRRALACAMDMQRFAAQYELELRQRGIHFGQTRIGVHSGEVIVGNFGGSTIFDYRALGDPVNTASRLEGANKQMGTLVCVSEATLSGCPDALVRPIGRLVLQGKQQAIAAFEPLDASASSAAEAAYQRAYQDAFELMQQMDTKALQAFEQLAASRPHDGLVHFHLDRLQSGSAATQGDLITLAQK